MRSLAETAAELGVPRRELRAWLQRTYPRGREERGRPWRLAPAQVAAARAHWRPAPRRRPARIAAAAAAVLAVLAALVAAAGYWQADAFVGEFQAGEKGAVVEAAREELNVAPRRPALPAEPRVPHRAAVEAAPSAAKTILLIGSDARAATPGSRRSDTIVLVHLEPAAERISLLSVPRDLYVDVPGHGRDRINTAFERGGVALLARTLRETLGVEINHFFEVDFGGFQQLVAALGGVYLPIDGRYLNRNTGTPGTNFAEIDLKPGYQLLDGRDTLAWVRYRHGDSDLVRAARQQLFLREASRQVVEARWSVLRLRSLLDSLAHATTSDVDDVTTLWRILRAVEETPASRIVRHTIPAREAVIGGASYVTASERQLRNTVRAWLGAVSQNEREGTAAEPGEAAPAATPAPQPALVPDGGRGAALARRLGGLAACVPTALPPGFWWPEADAARTYTVGGEPAGALWATRGSGRSLLWTTTTWHDAPALRGASGTVRRGGRTYELWRENGRLRQVAWRSRDVTIWITNTLRNELTAETMLRLADSCR